MNRTELIHSLINNTENGEFISKAVRGNTLWTIWKNEDYFIIAYQLVRGSDGWTYERQDENSPPKSYHCPKNYLTMAPVVCKDWRSEVEKYATNRKSNKSLIRELFKQKRKGQKLQVTIKAKDGYAIRLHDYALEEAILYVVSVYPGIEARFPNNGLRYSLPLRLVTDIRLLESNNQNEILNAGSTNG